MVFNLKDYLIYRNGSSMTVIRKSDFPCQRSFRFPSQMEAQTKEVTEKSWTAWKGNTLYKTINGGRTIEVEDPDALVSGHLGRRSSCPPTLPIRRATKS